MKTMEGKVALVTGAASGFMAVLEDRKANGRQDIEGRQATPVREADKYQAGKKTLQELTGKEEKAPAGANAFAPAVDTFLKAG